LIPIISIVIGAFLGSIISFVSFRHKERKAVHSKLNQSLFGLLSVWNEISASSFLLSEEYVDAYISGIKRKLPNEVIPEGFKSDMSIYLLKLMPINNGNELYGKYNMSVDDLSMIDPLLAFELSNNTFLVGFLKKINEHSFDDPNSDDPNFVAFKSSFTNLAYKESLEVFEKDLVTLSKRVNKKTMNGVKRKIAEKHQRMRKISDKDMDDMMAQILDPVLKKISS
tara:strand:- start:274 stop:948 length:675 start_codon:yes stop_codon:yes gene_type:complete